MLRLQYLDGSHSPFICLGRGNRKLGMSLIYPKIGVMENTSTNAVDCLPINWGMVKFDMSTVLFVSSDCAHLLTPLPLPPHPHSPSLSFFLLPSEHFNLLPHLLHLPSF